MRQVRIGIDVGGTFTDVVAIDAATGALLGQLKVPTTHDATDGVARGIVDGVQGMVGRLGLLPGEVVFIAHATTQATNALLEGDVAPVGIVGLGRGLEGLKARRDTRVPPLELAPGRSMAPGHRFVRTGGSDTRAAAGVAIRELATSGAAVIVASEAFGVDHPEGEDDVVAQARAAGLFATCGHHVSTLYGLRTRTRTAVVNGALLPKMLETAQMTARAVSGAGITAPLMIMRSDGGVMAIAEIERRPILTMLSGPAAGVAGALMHERVSDGIFVEVGGTSADISVIRDGLPQMRPARIGGHRTFLHTLDVRTIAIAGGSLIREHGGTLIDVGPRSAHIAGLPYACFAAPDRVAGARLVHLRPTPGDGGDYVAIESPRGERFALTPTCAANALGQVPDSAFAHADPGAARAGFAPLAQALGVTVDAAAARVLDLAAAKIVRQIRALMTEYHLHHVSLDVVGGGGGAAALVPAAALALGLPFRLARQAEVISTIGVALAMVRDTVERTIVDPTPDDILQIRREAADAAMRSGARPESIEVQVEVDTRRALVRASAFGTTDFRRADDGQTAAGSGGGRLAAARSLRVEPAAVRLCAACPGFQVFDTIDRGRRLGLFPTTRQRLRIVDRSGVVRLQRDEADVVITTAGALPGRLAVVLDRLTEFGDAGRALPDVHLLCGARLINLAGLATAAQVLALAGVELEGQAPTDAVVIVAGVR